MNAVIHHPPTIINKYLAAKINVAFDVDNSAGGSQDIGTTYFFPTLPTQIDALTETFPESNGVFAVYDRMFKMRRVPFPYIKCEQLLYYFYATGSQAQKKMIVTQQQVSDLLDYADDSARCLNEWAAQNKRPENEPIGPTSPSGKYWDDESKPMFFHNFKIYQLEETRDIVDFGTARTYAGNKIIIDYDWHPINPS